MLGVTFSSVLLPKKNERKFKTVIPFDWLNQLNQIRYSSRKTLPRSGERKISFFNYYDFSRKRNSLSL